MDTPTPTGRETDRQTKNRQMDRQTDMGGFLTFRHTVQDHVNQTVCPRSPATITEKTQKIIITALGFTEKIIITALGFT